MREIKVSCPRCRQHIACDESWSGQSIACPACQGPLTLPYAMPPALDPTPDTPAPLACRSWFATAGLIAGYAVSVLSAITLLGLFLIRGLSPVMAGDANGVSQPGDNPPIASPRPLAETNAAPRVSRPVADNPFTIQAPSQSKVQKPDHPATGRIASRDFTCEAATLENGWLKLRQGTNFFADAEIKVVLFSSTDELAGKTVTVGPTTHGRVPHIHLGWMEGRAPKASSSVSGYTLTVRFGSVENGSIAGYIDLNVPGARGASVSGNFIARVKETSR